MHAQIRKTLTAQLWNITFCCCSSSARFGRCAASAFFVSSSALSRLSASSGSVRSWGHAKIKIPSRSVGEKLTRYVFTELTDLNCTALELYFLLLLLIRFLLFGALLICLHLLPVLTTTLPIPLAFVLFFAGVPCLSGLLNLSGTKLHKAPNCWRMKRAPPAQILASDIHGLCHRCGGVMVYVRVTNI